MDGITFVQELRSIPTPKEPVVVFCTANGEAKDIDDGIAEGEAGEAGAGVMSRLLASQSF
jgi:CheY-like chemotaxis protein